MEWWQVLISVVVGLLTGAFIPIYLRHLEYTQSIKSKKYDRIIDGLSKLEQSAGQLTELLGGYRNFSQEETTIRSLALEIDGLHGTFRRYKRLNNSIREFMNTVGWIISNKGSFESKTESENVKQELEKRFVSLTEAIDHTLKKL